MNAVKRKKQVEKQMQEHRRQERIRQEMARQKKQEFLKKGVFERLKIFYNQIPSKRGKRIFWVWALPIFTIFLPIQAIIAWMKLDIAWAWTKQILYSFMNGK